MEAGRQGSRRCRPRPLCAGGSGGAPRSIRSIDCFPRRATQGCAHEEVSARDGGARRPCHHRAGAGVFRARPIPNRRRGGPAVRVLTADFNRDGRVDAATVNGTGSNLSVFLRGPSGFAAEAGSPFPVGSGPGYGFVADFNGDGFPDVATQNFSDGTVSVLIRQPGGGFAAEALLSVGVSCSVSSAVVNGDVRIFIAASIYSNSNLVTY